MELGQATHGEVIPATDRVIQTLRRAGHAAEVYREMTPAEARAEAAKLIAAADEVERGPAQLRD